MNGQNVQEPGVHEAVALTRAPHAILIGVGLPPLQVTTGKLALEVPVPVATCVPLPSRKAYEMALGSVIDTSML